MAILIFIITGFASLMLMFSIRKRDKDITSNVIISIIAGIFFIGIGTYRGCADGWLSTSIGRQGACSHHGGVETFINIYGVISLIVGAIIIIYPFLKNSK